MTFFRFLLAFDALVVIIILGFFITGLTDGSVGERNAGLWFLIVAACIGILGGSWWLHGHQHPLAAKGVLLMLAIPSFLFAAFFLILLITNPKWN
ncbi:hypothetical protein ACX0G9_16660 [Flavitalea flava]